jgi:MFS transporter, DHA2 family, multidrug resistance protein
VISRKKNDAEIEAYIVQLNTTDAVKTLFRRYGVRYAWIAMTTVMIAMMAALLTGTIVNVAIPQIMGTFGIDQVTAQWLSTANLAASTVGMLMTFWMVQTWGLRTMMVVAMALFLFGSVLGGLSPNIEIMIFARIIQGVTAGMVTPLTMSVIFLLFPAKHQSVAMGISSIGAILAPALGPALGGGLIDSYSWRYVYFLGVPLSLLCIPLALAFLPGREGPRPKIPFDWLGVVTLSSAITWMLIALTKGEQEGWSSNIIIIYSVLSAVSWLVFIYWQITNTTPLLNVSLFKYQRFSVFAIIACVFGAGLYGSTYLIPVFLQIVQGMTPTESGLIMMPAGIVMGVIIPFCGRMADSFDPRVLISWGALFFFLSFYLMGDADANTGFWTFAWWMCIGRIGIGLAIPSMSMGAMRSVPMEYVTQASGILNFVRQLGGAYGVNLLSMVLARRTQFHVESLYSTQREDNMATTEMLMLLQQHLTQAGIAPVEQPELALQLLAQSLHVQATVIAFKDSFLIAAVVFILMLIPTWMLKKRTA